MSDTLLESEQQRPRRRSVAVVVALVAAVMGTGIVIAATRDDTPHPGHAGRAAGVGEACRDWMSGSGRNDVDFCTGMTQWIDQRLTDGRMTGSVMWGDADRMLSTCRSSMPAPVPVADSSGDRCQEMVSWMGQRMGASWGDDWMMDGSMMRGG